jgi:curved DNA-binding protein CbpA
VAAVSPVSQGHPPSRLHRCVRSTPAVLAVLAVLAVRADYPFLPRSNFERSCGDCARRKISGPSLYYPQMDQTDWYEVLGLSFGCDDSAIAKAYRRLALKCHPDKLKPGTDQKTRDHAEKTFERIKQANEFLSDPQKKAALDASFKAKAQHALRQKEMEAGRRSQIDKLNEAEKAYKRAKVDGARAEAESAAAHDAIRAATMAQLQKSREEANALSSTSRASASSLLSKSRDSDSDDTLSDRAVTLSWRSAVPNAANMDEATLRAQVAACGDVDSVKIRAPKKNGTPSKSAIIVFRSVTSVELCLQLFLGNELWAAHALSSSASTAAASARFAAPPAPRAETNVAASAPTFPAPSPGMSHAEFEAIVLQQLMQASSQQQCARQ